MSIESEQDLVGLRRAGRVTRLALEAMRRAVRAGATTAEVDLAGTAVLRAHGARSAPKVVYGFPRWTLVSVNDEAVHGIPGRRRLAPGDLVKLDVTASLDGYVADAAITVSVPPGRPEARRLAACARSAFRRASRVAQAGRRTRDVGRAVEAEAARWGYRVLRDLTGHGVGRTIHEPPTVPNFDDPRCADVLTEGMVITIEPLVSAGSRYVREDRDDWTVRTVDGSLCAHHEHTLVVTRGRPLLLTPLIPMRFSRMLAAAALGTAVAACGGDGRKVLTVYSPHGREMLQAFEQRYEALHPDVDVQTVDMGSQEILDRLRSERANPQADVWWGAPAAQFQDAAGDSLLEPFAPTWAGALPPEARDAAGRWHGTYVTPEVIAYNSAVIPADQAPQDWEDILDPRWKGKVLIRDPMASGTMRTIFGMVMNRSLRATGDTAQGYQWLRRLDAATKEYVINPTMLYQKLSRQEGLITLWDMPDIEALQGKYPIAYVLPRSGTPLVVDGVAVVRGAPNAKAAREFVEWIGGTASVSTAARQFFRLPARTDIPADSLPPRLREARDRIRAEPIDWPLLQRRTPEWMRYWDEHVRGKGG